MAVEAAAGRLRELLDLYRRPVRELIALYQQAEGNPFVVGAPGTAKPPSDERAAAELDEGGGRELSAERSCLDLLRVLQHRGEAEARDFVARLQRSAGGGGLEPALGGTALRKAASASKSLLPDPSSFLPTALGSKLSDVVKKAGR